MKHLRLALTGLLAMVVGCSAPAAPTGGASEDTADTTLAFSVEGDPEASVHARRGSQHSNYDFGVVLKRGDVQREYWCVLWRNADANQILHCGPFSLVRAPADQYSLRVEDSPSSPASDPMANDSILALKRGQPKRVTMTRAGAQHPFTIAGRV